MNPLERLQAERGYVAAMLLSIHERMSAVSDETRDAAQDTADEADFRAGSEWMESTRPELDRLEAREVQITELRSLAERTPAAVVPGDTRSTGLEGFNVNTRTSNPYDIESVRTIADPDRRGQELRSRALDAAEHAPRMTTEQREAVATLIEHDGAQFGPDGEAVAPPGERSRYILEHGSPEYHDEFYRYMRTGVRSSERAALSLTGANGGYLMPFTLDPTIILTNNGAVNPFRDISTIKQITTNVWHGVSSAGVTAEWIAEATQVADASPTFIQPTITVYKADAYIQASMEVVADTAISGDIAGLIAEAKGRLESSAFATGDANGKPKGIVTAASGGANSVAGSSGAAGAADLVVADIFAMDNAMAPRYRPGATFVMNKAIANKVRQLNSLNGTPQNYAFWTDFGGGNPSQLIGYPVRESSDMDSTIVSGSNDDVIVLGDFSMYCIVDRMGLEMAFNPMVKGANQRPTGEVGWVAFWRTGADCLTSGAFKTLRL